MLVMCGAVVVMGGGVVVELIDKPHAPFDLFQAKWHRHRPVPSPVVVVVVELS